LIYKCGGIDKRTIEKFEKVRAHDISLRFGTADFQRRLGQLRNFCVATLSAHQNSLGGVLLAGSLFFAACLSHAQATRRLSLSHATCTTATTQIPLESSALLLGVEPEKKRTPLMPMSLMHPHRCYAAPPAPGICAAMSLLHRLFIPAC
jgi:hypothetical protein